MRIVTVLSTRPEIIRLSRVMTKLDKCCSHTVIYTGQNFDPKLSTIFFEELGIRKPDVHLGNTSAKFGEQIGLMFTEIEKHLRSIKPDKMLILGDTNGCLCSIIAKKLKIPIYHLEAGNRCGDWIDEEINRHLVDSISDVHLPYTTLSKENLVREGVPNNRIYVVGNPIYEVLKHYNKNIDNSNIIEDLYLKEKEFFLATFHRNENVTDEFVLGHFIRAFDSIAEKYNMPVVCSVHPKTRTHIEKYELFPKNKLVTLIDPVGLFDFVKLEKSAKLIITDSGTCPEEGTILGTPSVIIRKTTERPELIQCGSTMLSGTYSNNIIQAVDIMCKDDKVWQIPEGYNVENCSSKIVKILLGNI